MRMSPHHAICPAVELEGLLVKRGELAREVPLGVLEGDASALDALVKLADAVGDRVSHRQRVRVSLPKRNQKKRPRFRAVSVRVRL